MTRKKKAVEGARNTSTAQTKSLNPDSRSTATAAQRERILAALRRRPQSTEDLRKLGIFQVPARIKELRDALGFSIETVRVTVIDRESYSHPRAALYVLHEQRGGAQ